MNSNMKKYSYLLLTILISLFLSFISNTNVKANEIIATSRSKNIFGDTISSIQVYSDGNVELRYKYGLRKVDVYYCIKEECDAQIYESKNIMEASESKSYKNISDDLELYSFKISLPENKEYRVRVEAYFGANSFYTGTENLSSCSYQEADSNNKYIKGNSSTNKVNDSRIKKLLEDIKNITNTIILPLLYALTGIFLVVKGTILGVQIVKNAVQSF